MYIFPIFFVPCNNSGINSGGIFWGLENTPIAGITGIILIIATVYLIKFIYKKSGKI